MSITTRWSDTKLDSLDNAIALMLQPVADDASTMNWKVDKVFESNQSITFGKRTIIYNMLNITFDQITSQENIPYEDRTKRNEIFIISYQIGSHVSYIIGKNSYALQILRKLLRYEGKNEVIKSNFTLIRNDFFVWVIKKVYCNDNVIETGNELLGDILLDSITEFKGNTDDLLTKVTARGESVMNIISTLSFLLESSKLDQIRVGVRTDKHLDIEIQLTDKGTIAYSDEKYLGLYREDTPDERKAKIYLLIYLEIIPTLIQSSIDDEWNQDKRISFMQGVASDLSEKIDKKIETLQEPT